MVRRPVHGRLSSGASFPNEYIPPPPFPVQRVCVMSEGAFREYLTRSIVKAVSYRVIVVVADFAAVYLFTGRVEIALGFVIVSNIYTTGLYLVHERFWDRVAWGRTTG